MKKLIVLAVAFATLYACGPQPEATAPAEVNKEEVVVENILARRSVRKYTDQQVTQEQLETLMKCAINAPSANNKQPWEVRVVQDDAILSKVKGNTYNAPTVIFIAKDKENRFGDFDCGLLTQNIVLAAESMDLGTVIVGSVLSVLNGPDGKEIVESLDLPENYEVVVSIALGNKNERPEAKPREAGKVKYIN